MQTRAAVLHGPKSAWSVEDIELDDPKDFEVKVKFAASGLCHSDQHLRDGFVSLPPETFESMGVSQYPIIAGHEGAGVVIEVGRSVRAVKPGDHIVTSFVPACGRCPSCARGRQHLCDLGAFALAGRQIADGSSRHHTKDGQDLALMCMLGTFSPYSVIHEASCVKIDDDIPLDKAALIGCGVATGWGSAVYAAGVQPGETVVVVGLGGVGMSAVQGAVLAGARHVVAVDTVEWKTQAAVDTFGATHAAAGLDDAFALTGDISWGRMADKAILTVGQVSGDMIAPLMSLVAKGGRAVITGMSPFTAMDVTLSLFDLAMMRKELVGTVFGHANPHLDIPRLLRLYKDGKLKLDELVTRTYDLDSINEGYDDLLAGKNIRGLMLF